MDILERYIFDNTLSAERLLQDIDEYTLYCYYLDFEPELGKAYSSPLDTDSKPSFWIYESRSSFYDYMWRDGGKRMVGGGIFKLIKLMYGYSTYEEVYARVASDFEVEVGVAVEDRPKIVDKTRPITKPPTRIRIKGKEFSREGKEFWGRYGVGEDLLRWKQVAEVAYIWYTDEQVYPIKCTELTFAYPEYDLKSGEWHYQLYSPYSIEYKFRNCLKPHQVYGYHHLEYISDTLIITKSNKDILCLKRFGRESISPRSETTLIKPKTISLLQSKYKRVVMFYDNDEAGIIAASKYNLESVIVPVDSGCKDFSDYLERYKDDKSVELLKQLGV